MSFISGVVLGFIAGLVVVFFVWKNNQAKVQALAAELAAKVK